MIDVEVGQVMHVAAFAFFVLLALPSGPEAGSEEAPPVATATSGDGRFRLELSHVEVAPPAPGSTANPTVMLQGRVPLEGQRLVVGPGITIRRVTTPDGRDRAPQGLGYFTSPTWGGFAFHGVDIGPEPVAIALLEIETLILRLRDAEHRFETIGAGEVLVKRLPPYELSFSAEPGFLHVGVCQTDESIRAAKGNQRGPWPSNQAVACSARVIDANGKVLLDMGGNGTGGYYEAMFGRGTPGGSVAYPVTVTIPDPTPEERFPVVFRVRDLELPPIRDRHVSSSAWGEASAGLSIRADVPPRVEQGERVATIIEFVRQASGLGEGVTRLETRSAEAFLRLRLVPEGGGEAVVVTPDDPSLGMPEWPKPGQPEPNLARDPSPVRAVFPLARARAGLPPGRYQGVVVFSFPPRAERRPFYENEGARLWQGRVTSGTFPLEIVAEPKRTQVLQLPKALCLVKGLHLTYLEEDVEAVIVPRQNGYFLGARITYDYRGKTGNLPVESVHSGLPLRDALGPILTLPANHQGPLQAAITFHVYRTLGPPGHFWPDADRPETLWQRTYEVKYSAEQIEALR